MKLRLPGFAKIGTMKVIDTEKIPIKLWAEIIDESTLVQCRNLANLPFAQEFVAIMADAHVGYGMPIGGVLATDGYIVPNAVGVDAGCGMKARKTNLTEIDQEKLRKILNQIQRDVPTGFAHHTKPQGVPRHLQEMVKDFISRVPERKKIFDQVPFQIGTLGGGNHFIELQKGDDGHLWIMLHSGSRGIGKMICDHYSAIAEDKDHDHAPDLAALSMDSEAGQEYFAAMTVCLRFAEENRLLMLKRITEAIAEEYPKLKVEEAIDTHHNYAAWEKHFGRNLLVHRKGAVRAEGKVIIPGSMGTWSYIAEGLCNPESFCSCAHGAGRQLSRNEAMRRFTVDQVLSELKAKNIELFKQKKKDVAEEWAPAYKDIDLVMENQKDLAKPLVRLRPIGVVKG